ncbi:MAG: RNHCP domain-containing protein [bacterium]
MKKFKMIDVSFTCRNCGNEVSPLGYTARDHCPKCLYSIHIDNNPGDRANPCLGDLVPVNIEKYKDTYKIIYKCNKCNEIKKNIMANDDDFEVILKITSNLKI